MSQQRPRILGLHHLKFAVSNLDVSLAWYERVLGARRIDSLDHMRDNGSRYAAVCQLEEWSRLFLELRESPDQARKCRGWDPVTLTVTTRQDLVGWSRWLDEWQSAHSPIFAGRRGWLMVFEDPDRRRIRIYTRESHNGSESPDTDDYWLNGVV